MSLTEPRTSADGRAVSRRPGDEDARVVVLVRACGPRVLAYLTRRCLDREEAADLFGETLAILWRRRADLPPEDDEAVAWMIGVARGTLANSARARHRRAALDQRVRNEQSAQDPSGTDGSAPSEAVDAVLAALGTLSPQDQELLRLDAWDELTGAQVGQVLGISAAAARQRLARARSRLRAAVGHDTGRHP